MGCGLGIDAGTTKVALAVVDGGGAQLSALSQVHEAALTTSPGRAEQDAERILAVAGDLVRRLPEGLRARIAAIGFTGQMHGVVLHDRLWRPVSPLVTWQDRRTAEDPGFLPRLAAALGRPIPAGYALATLAWWAERDLIPPGARAATIHGLLAARWGGLARSPLDPGDAQAWGGRMAPPLVSPDLMPLEVAAGACIGALARPLALELGLRPGLPLAAPLGDNQASLAATIASWDGDCAFTIGTGCQCSVLVDAGWDSPLPASCQRRPFTASHHALVSAPLAGGSAWRWLAERVASWIADCGLAAPPLAALYARLDALGLAASDRLIMEPHFAGERHDPALTGSLSGLTLDGGSLGDIARALARGIARTARSGLPPTALAGRTRVVASGNALRRSALLRVAAEAEFGLPLVLSPLTEEAATGAALVARALVPSSSATSHQPW